MRAGMASGMLFGASWLALQALKDNLDDIIALATLEILQDPEVEDEILEYLNNVLDDIIEDKKFRDDINGFYQKITKHSTAYQAARNLFVVSFFNYRTLSSSITVIKNAINYENTLDQDRKFLNQSFKSAFKWKKLRTNSIMVPINNIEEKIFESRFLLYDTLFDAREMDFSKQFSNSLIATNKSCDLSIRFNHEQSFILNTSSLSNDLISSIRKLVNTYSRQHPKFTGFPDRIPERNKDQYINY